MGTLAAALSISLHSLVLGFGFSFGFGFAGLTSGGGSAPNLRLENISLSSLIGAY